MASGAPAEFLVADLVTGPPFVVAGLAAVWLRPASPAGPMLLALRRPLVRRQLCAVRSAGRDPPRVCVRGLLRPGPRGAAADALLAGPAAPTAVAHRGLARPMGRRSLGRLLLQDPVRLFDCRAARQTHSRCGQTWRHSRPSRSRPTSRSRCLASLVGLVAASAACCGRARSGGASAGRSSSPAGWRWASRRSTPSSTPGRTATQAACSSSSREPWSEVLLLGVVRGHGPWCRSRFLVATLRLRRAPGPLGPFAGGSRAARRSGHGRRCA